MPGREGEAHSGHFLLSTHARQQTTPEAPGGTETEGDRAASQVRQREPAPRGPASASTACSGPWLLREQGGLQAHLESRQQCSQTWSDRHSASLPVAGVYVLTATKGQVESKRGKYQRSPNPEEAGTHDTPLDVPEEDTPSDHGLILQAARHWGGTKRKGRAFCLEL